jgi:hypothetical protein
MGHIESIVAFRIRKTISPYELTDLIQRQVTRARHASRLLIAIV